MKALKVIGKILLWTLVVVVVALLALPLWIGPVVKGVANSVVPGKTGTGFHLGEFGLNPYVGTLHVGDMQLENPKGFSEKNAVALDKFAADLAVTSLFGGKKYRVESIELDGLTIYSDTAGSNFRQIAAAATSGSKTGGEKPAPEVSEPPAETPEAQPAGEEEPKPAKGLQIDRLVIKNVTLKYGFVPIKLPMDIELTDIGKDSEDGASFAEVCQMVYAKITGAAGSIGGAAADALKGVGGAATDAVKNVGGAAADALNGAGDAATGALKGASDAATDALKNVGGTATDAVKGATDAAAGVGGAATDAVKGAGDMLKGAGGAAADAVKGAGSGLMNMFKGKEEK